MRILERTNDRIKGFASLANIGYDLFEVSLEGEMYTYSIPGISEHCKAERVGNIHSDLAREYITSKRLDGYRQGYRPPNLCQ